VKSAVTGEGTLERSIVRPGGLITYTFVVKNNGNTTANALVLSDQLNSPMLSLVPNPAFPTPEISADRVLRWNLGTLQPGEVKKLQFVIKADEGIEPTGVITNVGHLSGRDSNMTQIDIVSNRVTTGLEPTLQPQSKILLSKRAETKNNDSVARPGDIITYTITAKNVSQVSIKNVWISDTLSSNFVNYIQDSAEPALTQWVGRTLAWDIGTLFPEEEKQVHFAVRINPQVRAGVVITNVALLTSSDVEMAQAIVKSNEIAYGLETSTVSLMAFTARRQANGVRLNWVTAQEIDTWSYSIYRANGFYSGQKIPQNAVNITEQSVLASGTGGGGATYEVIDADANTLNNYTYWLVETETNGQINVYGPAKWVGASRILLPLLKRK
jgi:uncharacterized repeat protein (TIGR01451 family)